MKKSIIIALVITASLFTVFAQGATDDGPYAGVTNKAYRPTDTNYYDGLNYSLFRNPADLANPRFRVQGISVESSSFNLANALQNYSVAESLSNITKLQWDKKTWINYILGLATEVGSGYNDIVSGGISTGAQLGNSAFGLNFNIVAKSMPFIDEDGNIDPDKKSILGNGYLPLVEYAVSFGYGRKVIDTDLLSLDVGATVHLAEKIYMKQINLDTMSALINKTMSFDSLPARGGFAVPVDLGVTLGLLSNHLKVSAMANNLNGYYYMKNYENLDAAATLKGGTDSYVLYTPWSISASVIYSPNFKVVNPTVAFEATDVNLFFQNELDKDSPAKELFKIMNLSAKVDIYDILSLRAAYKYGYPEFGVGVGYYGSQIELIYGYHDAGSEYGQKPVDTLTFRMKIGYGK
ncbi:MAG: hypothetical protein J5800_00910 [Spirochaetales bacterium]|nr:hypothetical protein [Spirochaetales bacterium]